MQTVATSSPKNARATPSNALGADRAEIDRAVALLFEPLSIVEVRIPLTGGRVVSGYFNERVKLAKAIQEADAKYRGAGTYCVLNPIDPALRARAYNRLQDYARYTTADNNILRRRWLPIDLIR